MMKTLVCLHSCGFEGSNSSWRHRACQLGPRVNTFTRTLKIETGFDKRCITDFVLCCPPHHPRPSLLEAAHTFMMVKCYMDRVFFLFVLVRKSICGRVCPSLSAAFQQPTGKGPRLPEVYCVISRLGCFDLFSTVSSVCLFHANAPHFCFETVSYGMTSKDVLLNVCLR